MVVKNPYHMFAKILVGYFGLLQLLHLYVLARAARVYVHSGALVFPASPPPDGWQAQTVPLLLATGVVDAVNAVVILLFVFAYFRGRWWWRPLGIVTLPISFYSAVMYLAAVLPSGAWQHHAAEYWSVAAAFTPVFLLMFLYVLWAADPAFWRQH